MSRSARQPAAARGQRGAKSGGTGAQRPQLSQRERLLDALIQLAARAGYQAVSVAQISSRARVSSATFYEQFADKEACLVAAYRSRAERLLERIEPVPTDPPLTQREWSAAARAALTRVLVTVQEDPDGARLLYIESIAGGPGIRKQRGLVLAQIERRAQEFLDSTPAGAKLLDLPTTALVGATRSIVSRHLRTTTEDQLPALADDVLTWVEAYGAATKTRWSTSPRALLRSSGAGRTRARPAASSSAQRLPRGRHGLPAGVVARSQRTRIIYGTAEVMMAKGYANTTVADIVAAAGVARDVFYEHFTDKHHAFLEAQHFPTQHILDSCAAAYFAADSWPQRVWAGLRTLLELIVENPALSHLRLVECYAAGPEAIRRAEDVTRSFAIFLEEGYRYRPQAERLPSLCSQAISGAIFELIRREIARDHGQTLMQHLPQLVYIAIAPFTGPEEAIALIGQLRGTRARARRVVGSTARA
jgi:AcrR family transcriptional regulator